jgi:O-acetylhomoserine (thiol)-lyase
VKPGDIDGWRAAIRPNTKLLFGETLGNPGLDVLDIPTVAPSRTRPGAAAGRLHLHHALADEALRPRRRPVFHSATKFLCGHGTVVGGVLVDGGSSTGRPRRFPELTEPYAGFHGMVFSEESTVGAFLLRARREGLRDFGACMSPHTAWLILQGIETLPLRMARHMENTRKVVAFLAAHPRVAARRLPGAGGPPQPRAGEALLPRGCGSVFSFDLKGSRAQGQAFIEALKIFSHLANVGRLPLAGDPPGQHHAHSAWTTRRWRRPASAGHDPLSIGLEDADDLIDDLKRALKAAEKAA